MVIQAPNAPCRAKAHRALMVEQVRHVGHAALPFPTGMTLPRSMPATEVKRGSRLVARFVHMGGATLRPLR